jgi:hypothetical protein
MTDKKKPDSGYRAFADEQQIAFTRLTRNHEILEEMEVDASFSWKTL